MLAIVQLLETGSGNDRRAGEARLSVGCPGTLRGSHGLPLTVLIEDLSAIGFRFSTQRHFALGTRFRLGLRGAGAVEAEIVRRADDAYGCTFTDRLTPAQLQSVFLAGEVLNANFSQEKTQEFATAIRWSGAARAIFAIGGGALTWLGVFAIIRAL